MNRRSVLQFLASVPVLGLLVPQEAKAAKPPFVQAATLTGEPAPGVVEPPWKQLSMILFHNYKMYKEELIAKGFPVEDDPVLDKAIEDATYAMFRYLLDGSDHGGAYEPGFPNHDSSPIRDVRIGVLTRKEGVFVYANEDGLVFDTETVLPMPLRRKMKARWSRELAEDLTAYYAIDGFTEMANVVGMQLATEVQCEVYNDARNGRKLAVYAFDLPMHLSIPVLPPKDFTICRRPMVSYAKAPRS